MNHERFTWTTSSYSMSNGGDCVEVGWRTSSYSVSNGGNCVEAGTHSGAPVYALRDSKHPDHGHLAVAYPEWLSFLREVKRGEV